MQIKDHVLLPTASQLQAANDRLRAALTPALIEASVARVPDDWLADSAQFATPAQQRQAYVDFLSRRLQSSAVFVAEAERARGMLV